MPAAKLFPSGTLNAMKSGGNDSLDTFIRQAIGKEPLLPFSRAADSPVQWIQLLHALDQPGVYLNYLKPYAENYRNVMIIVRKKDYVARMYSRATCGP